MSEESKHEKGHLSDKINEINSNEKFDSLLNYAKTNTIETIAYVLMVIGILWSLFDPFYGSVLVGAIFGIYFSEEISSVAKNYKGFLEEHGLARPIILGGAVLLLFFSMPGFFIGTAIAVALKELFTAGTKKKS